MQFFCPGNIVLNAKCLVGAGKHSELVSPRVSVLSVCLESKHHAIQTVFHELLVNSHELGSKGLKVVDSLVAQLQSVFIEGCHVGHLRL